jgi:hypothetical protein
LSDNDSKALNLSELSNQEIFFWWKDSIFVEYYL